MNGYQNCLKVAVRAESAPEIGAGHMQRCLCLIETLKNFVQNIEITVFCNSQLPLFRKELDLLSAKIFKPLELSSNDWSHAPFDLFIFDNYETDYRDEVYAKKFSACVMTIDDFFYRKHKCDIFLNQNVNKQKLSTPQRDFVECKWLYLGPKYALLRQEFAKKAEGARVRFGPVKNILVMMGGVDNDNITKRVIHALPEEKLKENNIGVTVVIGQDNPHFDELSCACTSMSFKMHVQPENLPDLMLEADLAIGAAGSSTWERCCLGLPSVAVTIAENQKLIGEVVANERCGISLQGEASGFEASVNQAVADLIDDPSCLQEFSKNALKVTSGQGAKLLAQGILQCLNSRS